MYDAATNNLTSDGDEDEGDYSHGTDDLKYKNIGIMEMISRISPTRELNIIWMITETMDKHQTINTDSRRLVIP